VDPTAYFHIVRVGAAHFANGAVKLTDWIAAMKADLGARLFGEIEPQAETIFYEAKEQAESDAVEADQSMPVQGEAFFKPDAIESIVLDASTDAAAGLELTQRTVYELAKAHILQGVHGEPAVMAAVHQDLQPFFPDLTERDVRRSFSQYGKATFPSKQADRVELREIKNLVRLQESIDRLADRPPQAPLRTGQQRDKPTKKIRDKQRHLNALMREWEARHPSTSPERLASVNESRMSRLRNQVDDLNEELKSGKKPEKGRSVEPTAEVIQKTKERDALKEKIRQIEEAKNPPPTPEEKYNITRGKQLRRRLKEIQARQKSGDYAKRPRRVLPNLTKENEQIALELAEAKMKFLHDQMIWEMENASLGAKFADNMLHLISLQRSIMTSYDDSAVLRQGGVAVFAHPIIGARNIKRSFAAVTKAGAHAIDTGIKARPNYNFAIKSKLEIMEIDSINPKKMEELYRSKWQKYVPGVPASGRLFVSFLNMMRMDLFDQAMTYYSRRGVLSVERGQDLANLINVATGRGVIGTRKHNLHGTFLTFVAFAPKWVASRFNLLFGQPFYRGDKITRQYVAKEYARMIGGFLFFHTMLALMFSDDEDKPGTFNMVNSDFGKIRVGNTRLDVTAGMSTAIVFISRMVAGWKQTQSGKYLPLRDAWRIPLDGADEYAKLGYGNSDAVDVSFDFFRRKSSPPVGFIFNLASGIDPVGRPITPIQAAGNMFVPLSMNDYLDAMEEHGFTKASALQAMAFFGVSMQTYSDSKPKNARTSRPSTRVSRSNRRGKRRRR
jgi:hypothetical protein